MSLLQQLKKSVASSRVIGFTILAIIAMMGLTHPSQAYALETKNTVNLYLFYGEGCPHCAQEMRALEPYIAEQDNITYSKFEIYYNPINQKLMKQVGEKLKIDASGVPLTIVGDEAFIGYSTTTGAEIRDRLGYCSTNACPDSVAEIVGATKPDAKDYNEAALPITAPSDEANDQEQTLADKKFDLPIFGSINAADFSLPILTIMIALLDGFNPCAMWALLFIITLLIGMHDRKRMWIYGTAFIAASAVVYLLFMAAWLNLFLFIGHVSWLRSLIGLFAIGIGAYYLYDWYQKKTGCSVAGSPKRKAILDKLRNVVKAQNFWLGLGGVMLLAASVNVIELACSAGLPVLYTGILSSSGLESWQYLFYMLLYILIFMLDDLIVFAVAMTTLKVTGIESKYTKTIRLFGGVVMIILGYLLIFSPQVLMFG